MKRKSHTKQNLSINLRKSRLRHSDKQSDRHSDRSHALAPAGDFSPSTGTAPAVTKDIPGPGFKSMPSQPGLSRTASHATGQVSQDPPSTGQAQLKAQPSSPASSSTYGPTGPGIYPPAAAFPDLPDDPEDSEQFSYSEPDEGELSDSCEKHEVTEDMNYRETVRSVRSFMGWNHIPVFEADFSEPDKSNNPWKGKVPKRPARVSVAMPPDDWLCQKLERLKTTVAEGYLSRSQNFGGLKKDQFIMMPKSQSRWYQMHTIKPHIPHRPGKSVFSWRNTEAKVNFPTSPRLLHTLQLVQSRALLLRSISKDGRKMLKRAITL